MASSRRANQSYLRFRAGQTVPLKMSRKLEQYIDKYFSDAEKREAKQVLYGRPDK